MSSSTPSPPTIKTRFLVLSDTHGAKPRAKEDYPWDTDAELSTKPGLQRAPTGYREPLAAADIVLHCGDLTKRGQPAEAEQDGVRYLVEGTHSFDHANGARLRVYASQYTPQYGYWAFQYYYRQHGFDIPPGVDVAMTHGPPQGILDVTALRRNAGCDALLSAIHRARPKMHCFGHIHESWGAYLAQWKKPSPEEDDRGEVEPVFITQNTVVDAANSRFIQSLHDFKPRPSVEGMPAAEEKHKRLLRMSKQRGFHVDLTEGENQLRQGEQTLFVNAAIMDLSYLPTQMPWLVDVELPKAE